MEKRQREEEISLLREGKETRCPYVEGEIWGDEIERKERSRISIYGRKEYEEYVMN